MTDRFLAFTRTVLRLNVLVWFLLAIVLTPFVAAALGFAVVAYRRHKVGMAAVRAVPTTSRFDIWDGWTELGFTEDFGITLTPVIRDGVDVHASIAGLTFPTIIDNTAPGPWSHPSTWLDGARIDQSARWQG